MSVLIRSAFCLCSVAVFGAERWTAPVLGFVFDDDSKAVYSVSGVPGAATLDRAIAIPSKIDRATVALGGRPWAVVGSTDGTTSVAVWTGLDVRLTKLEGAVSWTDAAWSGADRVALWNRDSGEVQLWGGVAGSPALAMETALPGVQTVAVSDEGALAAASPHQLHVWQDGSTKQYDFSGITALAWQSTLVAATSSRVSALSNGQLQTIAEFPPGSAVLSISPGGEQVLTCTDGTLHSKLLWGGLQPAAGVSPASACPERIHWLRNDVFIGASGNKELFLNGVLLHGAAQ